MNLFKLCSILISLSILSGCASISSLAGPLKPDGSESQDRVTIFEDSAVSVEGMNNSKEVLSFSGPDNQTFLRQILEIKDPEQKNQKIYGLFCRNQKVVRNPKKRIILAIPKVPAGMPIDEALALREKFLEHQRTFIKEDFFRVGSIAVHGKASQNKRDLEASPMHNQYNWAIDLFGFTSNSWNNLIPFFKSQHMSDKWDLSTILVQLPGDETLYMVPDRPNMVKYASTFNEIFKIYVPELKINQRDNLGVSKLNPPARFFKVSERAWKLKSGDIVYPLDFIYFTDLDLLKSTFTLILPEPLQQTSFGRSFGYSNPKHHEGPSISEILRESDQIWHEYSKSFTSVKESSTNDASIVNIEVSLDMSPFCTYGRAKSALISN